MVWMVLGLALAAPKAAPPTEADQLVNHWLSLQTLRLDPTRYRVVSQPFTMRDGPLELTIDEGLLVPVFSGHSLNDRKARRKEKIEAWAEDGVLPHDEGERGTIELVGFVWVAGNGSFQVDWSERADHQTFANHMVRNLKNDRDDFAHIARGEPWTGTATEAVVLSVDPQIEQMFLGPDDPEGHPMDIVVYGEKSRPGALVRARAVAEQRSDLMGRVGLDPGNWIARDRVAVARGRMERGAHSVIDVHVDGKLGQITVGPEDQPDAVDWMTLVRDETGGVDTRRHTNLWALDNTPRGAALWRITGQRFPSPTPSAPPVAPVRLEAEDAYAIVGVHDGGASAFVEIVARLKLRAVGGTIDYFDLNIPRTGPTKAFTVVSATLPDGTDLLSDTPLIEHDPVLRASRPEPEPDPVGDGGDDDGDGHNPDPRGDPPPDPLPDDPYHDRPESRITLIPPEPIEPGESLIVDVHWTDRWPMGGAMMLDIGSSGAVPAGTMVIGQGASSGRKDVLPRLPGSPEGNPSKFTIRMVTQKRKYLISTSSGAQIGTSSDGEFVTTESKQTELRVPFAQVAVGDYTQHDVSASGYPTIRARMFGVQDAEQMGPEIRRLIGFYEGFMPPYPWPEHEVMQVPGVLNGWVWVAPYEMTATMRAGATGMEVGAALAREGGARLGQNVLAHEIAHQWWGHNVRPAHVDDFWISETFAESMAQMYMGAAFGTYESGMVRKREEWEKFEDVHIPRASLTDAYSSSNQPDIVYRYGPYLFQEMLRPRIGHTPYHAALDVLQRDYGGQAITTELLKVYLEEASGRDLAPFFDFWVHGGFIPERVELIWTHRDGKVVGTVTGDVPFGTFDIEVQVDEERVWVDVTDGVGHFELDRPSVPETVALDPDFRTLCRKRVVTQGDPGATID